MKENNIFVNVDKDTVCFIAILLMFAGIAVTMAIDCRSMDDEKKRNVSSTVVLDDLRGGQDGTYVNYNLPARTNMGDTLYVIGKNAKRKNLVYVHPRNGQRMDCKIMGAERINPGDTIVVHPDHKFLMKNITQRNLEKQK